MSSDSERYVIQRQLGKSIYGHVYLANDQDCGRVVAIKRSSVRAIAQLQQHLESASFLPGEDPIRESAVMKVVGKHPHILHREADYFSRDGLYHHLVMEYAPNGDLFEYLTKHPHTTYIYDATVCRNMYTQLLSAVDHLHQHNICHLDLSPENVLISREGTLKVCDFGVAQLFDPENPRFAKQPRAKLHYMNPEAVNGRPFSGPMADIYSLGVVFFAIALGTMPCDNASDNNRAYDFIKTGHLGAYLERSGAKNDSLPPTWLDLISGMLAPETRRLNLRQIMHHPFFTQPQPAPTIESPRFTDVPVAVGVL
jgi:BR serine/threonine kinase